MTAGGGGGGHGRYMVHERVRSDMVDAATCRQELRVDDVECGVYVWARIAQLPPLLMLLLVGNV